MLVIWVSPLIIQKNTGTKDELLLALKGNALIHNVIEKAEIESLGVSRTLRLGADDALVAYNWTTTLIAQKAGKFLNDPHFYYFAQEDERIFYPNDSTRFMAESVFHLGPRLICNSGNLRDHFKAEGLIPDGAECAVFEQGIPPCVLPDVAELAGRKVRKFLFYGRPEDHAKRNLYTIAIMALERAIAARAFSNEPWEFYMLGSSAMGETFSVQGREVKCLPRMGYVDYLSVLPGFDLGMCLMYAPHPSVPPFEMVRAGVVTVVNRYKSRDADWYAGISGNFVVGDATGQGMAAALIEGARKTADYENRLREAHSFHPDSWHETFTGITDQLSHRAFHTNDGAKVACSA